MEIFCLLCIRGSFDIIKSGREYCSADRLFRESGNQIDTQSVPSLNTNQNFMRFLILLLIPVILVFWMISLYNKLVRKRAMAEEGWAGIDVQLKKRYDLIPNLLETVKGYAKHEQETLQQVISARNQAQAAGSVQEQQAAEKQLNTALANVFALSEAYPDLKANQGFVNLQNQLSAIEGDIEKARRYYNATVRELNIMVESFPSNLLAGPMGFDQQEYFELDNDAERANPQVKF